MTNRSKWLVGLLFALLVSLIIPALATGDIWWFAKTAATILFASLSFGMWLVATAFVDVERPRGDPDLANLLLPLALILVVPLAAYDHTHLIAATMPGAVAVAGVLFSALAIFLGIASRFYLGRSYSPSPFPRGDDLVVQAGPYHWIRHPLYAATFLWVIGWPLIVGSLLSAATALMLVIPAIAKRMRVEEAQMVRQFGATYERYRSKTWRLIPYVY